MKAVLTDKRFSDPEWVYERKLDGVRCVAVRNGRRVRALSRNDLSMNERYPELVQALEAQRCERFAVDGEVVAFDRGQTSFARLSQRARRSVPVFYYVFDITWLDGHDLCGLPLRARKRLLRRTLRFQDPLRLTTHRVGEGLLRRGLREGLGGADRQAGRLALQHIAVARLAEA